jgi:uncharacterized membrane protein
MRRKNMGETEANKTSSGIQQNVAGLLCYLVGWVTGIIFLITEKENKFVRFHAWQSIIVFGAYMVVAIILSYIPFIGWIIGILLGIAAFILWVVLMYNAYQGKMLKLPVAGNIAENQTKSKA